VRSDETVLERFRGVLSGEERNGRAEFGVGLVGLEKKEPAKGFEDELSKAISSSD
jgi:hypothetical protein